VNWLWIGSLVFLLGILIAAWPRQEVQEVSARVRRAQRADRSQPSAAD
jgi:hypothetical protein